MINNQGAKGFPGAKQGAKGLNETYTKQELDAIFAKGQQIPGQNPAQVRKDDYGNVISRTAYGDDRSVQYHWEVDHKNPNGGDGVANLRPLNGRANASKSDGTHPAPKHMGKA